MMLQACVSARPVAVIAKVRREAFGRGEKQRQVLPRGMVRDRQSLGDAARMFNKLATYLGAVAKPRGIKWM